MPQKNTSGNSLLEKNIIRPSHFLVSQVLDVKVFVNGIDNLRVGGTEVLC